MMTKFIIMAARGISNGNKETTKDISSGFAFKFICIEDIKIYNKYS